MEILSGDSLISKLKEYMSLGYRVYNLTYDFKDRYQVKKFMICPYEDWTKSVYIRPV